MKLLNVRRFISLVVAAVILTTSLIGTELWVTAAEGDINNPPTAYPENCVKQLNADLDFEGNFVGGNCYATRTEYPRTDLTKYDAFEMDIFIESTVEESVLRIYFLDSTYKNSNEGRGFRDVAVKTNQWDHVSISNWETGYGMGGDTSDARGYLIEGRNNEDTRLVVKNVCVTADDIVSPDELPDEIIAHLKGKINTTVTEETVEDDLTAKFAATDFSYGDNIELDYYIGSDNSNETVDYVLVDENGKKAVYSLNSETGKWIHLALTTGDFAAEDGFDIAKVTAVKIENTVTGARYYFDNLCVTGLAWPTDLPEGTAEQLYTKFDYTDSAGGKATLTPYGKTVDFTAHDFFEFDIYIESSAASDDFNLFLYDATYDPETTSSLPGSSKRRMDKYTGIATNEWVHIRVVTSDIGSKGTGDLSQIAGFYFTGLDKDNRYVIVNQCLSDLVIPEADYNYTVISTADKNLDFKGKAESTDKVSFDTPLDLTAGKYFELDINAVSMDSSIAATLVLEDENGGSVSQSLNITANTWEHKLLKVSDFTGNADLTKIKSAYITGVSAASRTAAYNMAVTAIITPEPSYKYTLDEEIPFNWEWYVQGDQTAVGYFNEDKSAIDLTQKEFMELDICFETSVENPSVRMFFVDEDGKLGFYDFISEGNTSKDGWYHFTITANGFNSGWGFGGDPTKAIGLKLVWHGSQYMNSTIHVKNIAFTYFEKPELNTRYDVIYDTGISTSSNNISGTSCLSTRSHFTGDKAIFDISTGSHIEMDVFVESEYETQIIRAYFLDSTYSGANTGRGFIDIIVETNSWQHVLMEVSMFNTGYEMNGEREKCTGFMFESGGTAGTMYHFHNVAVTKKKEVPVDIGNKASEPDKDSRYISNADSLMNALGIWNTSGMETLSQYKTEGKASVGLTVRNQDDSKNSLRFLFDGAADLSASKSVRFDLFIDDVQLAKQNTIKVSFTSNKRFTDKAYNYYIDTKALELGWNSFEISLKAFTAESGADWGKIYGFAVGLENTNLGTDDYFLMGIDNLRLYKTFVAAADNETMDDIFGDGEDEEDYFSDDNWGDTDFTFDTDFTIDTTPDNSGDEPVENTSGSVKKIIRRRRANTGMSIDIIVLIVVCIVGGVLLITGIVFAILTERKYRKLLKQQR